MGVLREQMEGQCSLAGVRRTQLLPKQTLSG
jgi:hypothetical protein